MENGRKIMAYFWATLSVASAITLVGYSFSQVLIEKSVTSVTKNKFIGWTREDEEKNKDRYLKDALLKDAIEKSKTDSVLFYKITTNGVITRFSLVAHIMKILELNPNKEIRIFAIDALNLDEAFFNQKDKFPNLKFRYFDESFLESSVDTYVKYDFNVKFLEEVIQEFGDDKKIDGYFDDYSFMTKILLYVNGLNAPINRLQIYNEFSLFAKLESMNFFSDGTKSVEFFEEPIKKAFLLSNNLYDSESKNYANAKMMRENVKNNKISKEEFLKGNNALLFLTSLITNDFSNSSSTKYFLPTTDFISEINRPDGNNYKNGTNDVFSPFNSLNLDVISFIKNLNQKDIKQILKIKEDFDPSYYIGEMNGKDNYVYAGTLLDTPTTLRSNANTLIAIRKYAQKTTPNIENHDKIVVWFKGHPRDTSNIQAKLKDEVKKITNGADDGSWIRVLDHEIPFEFYSVFNVFTPDPSMNKNVFIFTSYSTLVMMSYAENQGNEIAKIIIDNSSIYSINRIINLYGENSKIFPKDKLTTLEDFENSNS